jgi:Uma2 family endonuclease
MSHGAKILPSYTYEDYLHWEGRWELIDGIPYAMSPLPTPRHQRIATRSTGRFESQLEKCSSCVVYQPLDYRVSEETVVQPDMLVVCGEIHKPYLDFPPALVVEILSPSTALKDRHTKFSIYEGEGVGYYLIVAPETEEVEVYGWNDGSYRLARKGHDFTHEFTFGSCSARVDFKEIWP